MRKSKFEYKGRTKEQIENAALGNRRKINDPMFNVKGLKMFKPRDGQNRIRILPPTWDGFDNFGYMAYINYSVGADNSAFLSRWRMLGEKDPIQEERNLANQEGNDEYAKKLAPRPRLLTWVIDRKAEDEGPQLWTMPATIAQNINTLSCDESSGEVLVPEDPDEGFDILFNKEGQGVSTRYSGEAIARHSTPLSDDKAKYDSWLDYVQEHCIPDILIFYDYEHIANVFAGGQTKQPVQSKVEVTEEEDSERTDDNTVVSLESEDEEGLDVPWNNDSDKDDSDDGEEEPVQTESRPSRASAGTRRLRRRSA